MREPTELEKQQYQRMIELSELARKRYIEAGGDPRRAADDQYLTQEEKKEFLALGKLVFAVNVSHDGVKQRSLQGKQAVISER